MGTRMCISDWKASMDLIHPVELGVDGMIWISQKFQIHILIGTEDYKH